MTGRGLALATVLTLALPATAVATTFRGSAVDDPQTPVRLRVSHAGVVLFDYQGVAVKCTNGDEVREPGAEHSTTLAPDRTFKDRIEQDLEHGATGHSFVKGRVGRRKATGVLSYDLDYGSGECHSGELRWKAHRKKAPQPTAALRFGEKHAVRLRVC